MIFGQGKVDEHELCRSEIEKCIEDKVLYVIEDPNYPKTEQEATNAKVRFCERHNEKDYALGYNNCEHLATFILKGNPCSEQIETLGCFSKFMVDTFDYFVSHGKSNALNISACLVATWFANSFLEDAVTKVVNAAKDAIKKGVELSGQPIPVDRVTEKIVDYASEKLNCDLSELLKHRNVVLVAQEATETALLEIENKTFSILKTFQFFFFGYEMIKLIIKRIKGHITTKDLIREILKRLGGAVGATYGGVWVGLTGLAMFPLPVFGFAVGSIFGSIVGSWLASAFVGQAFDCLVSFLNMCFG